MRWKLLSLSFFFSCLFAAEAHSAQGAQYLADDRSDISILNEEKIGYSKKAEKETRANRKLKGKELVGWWNEEGKYQK